MELHRSITPGMGVVTLTAEMGTAVGDTKITPSNPTGTFLYKSGVAPETPEYLEDLTAWSALDGDITAATDVYITVARVNASNKCLAYGYTQSIAGELLTLTVSAVAETENEGFSTVTFTPDTGTFVYLADTGAYEPTFREVLTEGWTAIESGDAVEVEEGKFVTVCQINASNECLAVGSKVVADNDTDTLTVTSVAGTEIGDTNITFSPDGLGVYVYKIAESAITPTYRQVLTTGWTNTLSNVEITATTGHFITVALIDANDRMLAFGTDEIVSKSA